MATFSIKDALVYGFSTYAKHLVLCICVGLTLGATQWGLTGLPSLVAEQLGVKAHVASSGKKMGPKATMAHNAARPSGPVHHDSKRAEIHHHLKETGKKIHQIVAAKAYSYMDNDPVHLFILFIVWLAMFCLWVFVTMGIIRVALDLVDKNTSSYERLFSQKALFFPFLGVLIVFMLLMLVIVLGAILAGGIIGGLLAIPLVFILGETGGAISALVGFIAGIVVYAKFLMRYFFCTFCLVDKKMGVHKAFSATYEITKGSVFRLLIFGIILSIPFMFGGSVNFHVRIGTMAANDSYHAGIIGKLVLGLFSVWYSLCLAHVYRKLSRA